MPLPTELFDYTLPPELIAQTPAAARDRSRLLVVDRQTHAMAHGVFSDLPRHLRAGDALFRNTAKVLPARLSAIRPSGGKVECLLLERVEDPAGRGESWRSLVKPARKLGPGARFADPGGAYSGEIVERLEGGEAVVRFSTPDGEPMAAIAERLGEMPLPPYISRPDGSQRENDRARYQTVYADPERTVAAAAPTAGLHFTKEVIAELGAAGVRTFDLTLHVGLGTFRPIATDVIETHAIHSERYEMPAATQRALFPPLPGRRIAVGTTSARAIEDFLSGHDAPLDRPYSAAAGIYLHPPRRFLGVDALLTNFHQPRSTLLCLVSAFLAPGSADGIAWFKEIYAEAIARRYRFFSYGDAMLIL